jgi:pyridoxal biosynthesis lyase PdxS
MRKIRGEIRRLSSMSEDELFVAAKELQAPYELVREVAVHGRAAGRCCSPRAGSRPRRTPR